MPYDQKLAGRVRRILASHQSVTEKKMFGGIAFLVNGNMCCGVCGDKLMLRLGNEGAEAALRRPNTRPMDFTGRPMKSMVFVTPEGVAEQRSLRQWVHKALDFAHELEAK